MVLTPLVGKLGFSKVAGAAMSPIISVFLFSIILPTLDIVTDLIFICKLYVGEEYPGSHYRMATALLIPFLLNYFLCLFAFLRKASEKKYDSVCKMLTAAISALFNLFPQFGKLNKHFLKLCQHCNFLEFQRPQRLSFNSGKTHPRERRNRKFSNKILASLKPFWNQSLLF